MIRGAQLGWALVAVGVLTASCSPTYVARAAWEEARILWRREAIAELLASPSTDAPTRAKLEMVLEVRERAAAIGFDVGGSYSSLSEVDARAVVHVVTAAKRARLVAHTWWFPVVGHVPYKGYFEKALADREAETLAADGHDVYVRPSVAFSTLGWFDDPLLSTLLRLSEAELAVVVFHELFHNTLYVPGQGVFNESAANAVGYRAAIEYFCDVAERSEHCAETAARWRDAIRVGGFFEERLRELAAFYEAWPTPQALEAGRAARFTEIREGFAALPLETQRYRHMFGETLNNATLLADYTYFRSLADFDALFDEAGSVAAGVAALRELAEAGGDPFEGLSERLESADPEVGGDREDAEVEGDDQAETDTDRQ